MRHDHERAHPSYPATRPAARPRLVGGPADRLGDVADMTVGDLTQDDSMAGDGAPGAGRRAAALRARRPVDGRLCLVRDHAAGAGAGHRLALLDTIGSPIRPSRPANRRDLMTAVRARASSRASPGGCCRSGPSVAAWTTRGSRRRDGYDRTGRPRHLSAPADGDHRPRRTAGPACRLSTARRWSCAGTRTRRRRSSCTRDRQPTIPNARLDILPECGHLSPLERPETVNAALRSWLVDED